MKDFGDVRPGGVGAPGPTMQGGPEFLEALLAAAQRRSMNPSRAPEEDPRGAPYQFISRSPCD